MEKQRYLQTSHFLERHRGRFLLGFTYYLQKCFLLALDYFEVAPGSTLREGRLGEEVEESTDINKEGAEGASSKAWNECNC